MKNKLPIIVLTLLAAGFFTKSFAQAPGKLNYQAVVRNSSGALVTNSPIGVSISILQGSATGNVVFREVISPNPQTNSQGLLSLEVGSGIAQIGTFTGIDWSAGPFFIQTEVDINGGTSYQVLGVQQLLSVPYALYSNRSGALNYQGGSGTLSPTVNGILYWCNGVIQTTPCLPSITTTAISAITGTGASSGGHVTSDGGAAVTARGVAYGTGQNPTLSGTITSDGTGTGVFTSTLSGLTASTSYYVRAYATNSVGTAYGNEVSFTTTLPLGGIPCPGVSTVTDVDGNVYQGVQIGTQCWTQSNLKVSKYRNGDNIPTGLSNADWQNTTSGAYAIYNNDSANDILYGKLYNHYAVTDSRGLCPTGWHVPSDGEWNVLVKYLDPNADTVCGSCWQSSSAGGALKSTATQPTPGGWSQPNTGATNSSGFSAPPGGLRGDFGDFDGMTYSGCWWSSSVSSASSAWGRDLDYGFSLITRDDNGRTFGFSVRCCRD